MTCYDESLMSVNARSAAPAGTPAATPHAVPAAPAAHAEGTGRASGGSLGGLARIVRSILSPWRRASPLYRKYAVFIASLVGLTLLVSGTVEAYFSFLEQRAALVRVQQEKAAGAAAKITQFVSGIEKQLEWAMPPEWIVSQLNLEQRRADYRRLLRQAEYVTDVRYLDSQGYERLRVSRVSVNARETLEDHRNDPRFVQARAGQTHFSAVYFRDDSEPYMTVAVPERGAEGGVTIAEVNLKFVPDVVSGITVGRAGYAYVLDADGRLIAHPDISLVLQQRDLSALPQARAALDLSAPGATGARVSEAADLHGRPVLTASEAIEPPGWHVFVEQPLEEAYATLYASLLRAGLFLAIGLLLSMAASLVLARRMVTPIQALQTGAARIGAGALDQRIVVRSGDELEALADEFNQMTARLRELYASLEQKVAERTRDLEHALEELEMVSRHKSELLGTVSHELRTPLGAIKGYGTALLRFGSRIRPAERREFLESIDRATDRLTALIDDLLLAQRLEAGALPINTQPLTLAPLVQEVVGELAPRALEHVLVSDVAADLCAVRGDPPRVRQVLVNLIDNAIKYSPAGGEVRVSAAMGDREVVISVQDQGVGIAEDQIARVFERFYRIESETLRTTRGTGLGLAICQGIVEAHGGRIWATSPGPGEGSTLSFTLPVWSDE